MSFVTRWGNISRTHCQDRFTYTLYARNIQTIQLFITTNNRPHATFLHAAALFCRLIIWFSFYDSIFSEKTTLLDHNAMKIRNSVEIIVLHTGHIHIFLIKDTWFGKTMKSNAYWNVRDLWINRWHHPIPLITKLVCGGRNPLLSRTSLPGTTISIFMDIQAPYSAGFIGLIPKSLTSPVSAEYLWYFAIDYRTREYWYVHEYP